MISLVELRTEAGKLGVAPEVMEKDYCLGWLVYGIAKSPLREGLMLKGGTALRKGFFPEYRFSEDLDYTTMQIPAQDDLRQGLEHACRLGKRTSGVTFALVAFERVREDEETPAWSAKISFVGPRSQAREPRRIQLHITAFETVILEPEWRSVYHPYSDAVEAEALFYRLEEILAEKLRTLLQRGYPRDVYDVWYLMKNAQDRYDAELVRGIFRQKCDYKGVACGTVEQVLEVLELKNTATHWSRSLGMQIRDLPEFGGVRRDLEVELNALLG